MESDISSEVDTACAMIAEGEAILTRLGILRSQRDLDVDLTEWWVADQLGGERAESAVQRDFDVVTPEGRVQVKKNRKAQTNPYRDCFWVGDRQAVELVALVKLTQERRVEEWYLLPMTALRSGLIGKRDGNGWLVATRDLCSYQMPM